MLITPERFNEVNQDFLESLIENLLRQIMNSKNIEAYCIQCKTPLKGYYKSFDWKEIYTKD